MNKILKILSLGILLASTSLNAQEFFVNTIDFPPVPPSDNVYKLNISNASVTPESFCIPAVVSDAGYTDIALDKFNNFYYVTSAGLLYGQNKQEGSSCQFLGDFSTGTINSLTADWDNNLYAIGSLGILYKYDIDSATFSVMGNVPGVIPGGDLFFYENRLFLTTTEGIIEINMVDPSQSCPFINSGSLYPSLYAGFSVDYGSYSKAYVINNVNQNSVLYEVDMVNHQIGNPIRTYNHRIYGATTAYSLTSSNSTCSPTLSTKENKSNNEYFDVINPAINIIKIKTNIRIDQITSIRLYDLTGKLVRDFNEISNIESLNIADISTGAYLLTLSTKKGETHTKKIIIKS